MTQEQKPVTSTQHTSGPWEASTDAHGRGRIHGGGAWLASTWLATEDGNNVRHLPAVANARLIAAAPELLAIAKRVSEWERRYPAHRIYSEGETRSIAAEMTAIVKDADAAIAKATREQVCAHNPKP